MVFSHICPSSHLLEKDIPSAAATQGTRGASSSTMMSAECYLIWLRKSKRTSRAADRDRNDLFFLHAESRCSLEVRLGCTAEHLLRALSGPVKVIDRPVDEGALECLRLGQADGPVVSGIALRQQRRAQKRRVRQVGMVIWKGAELDQGAMRPQRF